MVKTCSSRLAFLYRNSRFLDQYSRKILCSALIQPYMDYCSSSWYSALTVSAKERLCIIQRKMVRFIHNADYRQHIGKKDLQDLKWLLVPDRVTFFRMMHVFRIRHKLAPKYLLCNFSLLANCHSYNTRGRSCNFALTRDMSCSPNSFTFTAAKEWNALPNFLKEVTEFCTFKRKLKEYLISFYG